MYSNSEEIFRALKSILKARKITYKSLGTSLQISEAGIKKMFLAQDCSISRLSEICNAMGITLNDLVSVAKKLPVRVVELKTSQADFLVKNPHYWNFFRKLAHEKLTVNEIAELYCLDKVTVRRYLKKLDELGLIEIHPGDRILINMPSLSKVKMQNSGLQKMMKDDGIKFIREIDLEKEHHSLGMINFTLSEPKMKKFFLELFDLIDSYYLQSDIELSLFDKRDLQKMNLLVAIGNHSFTREVIPLKQ